RSSSPRVSRTAPDASPSGRNEKSSADEASRACRRRSPTRLSARSLDSSVRSTMRSPGLVCPVPQAERTHVRPDLLDIRQAFLLRALLPPVGPARWILAIGEPDRILHLVVDDDLVDGTVLARHRL